MYNLQKLSNLTRERERERESKIAKTYEWMTLIELLITISVIWILSVALYWWYTGYIERSRDSARKIELHGIKLSIESFINQNYKTPKPSNYSDENIAINQNSCDEKIWENIVWKIPNNIKNNIWCKWKFAKSTENEIEKLSTKFFKKYRDPKTKESYNYYTDKLWILYVLEAMMEIKLSDEVVKIKNNMYNKDIEINWKIERRSFYYLSNLDDEFYNILANFYNSDQQNNSKNENKKTEILTIWDFLYSQWWECNPNTKKQTRTESCFFNQCTNKQSTEKSCTPTIENKNCQAIEINWYDIPELGENDYLWVLKEEVIENWKNIYWAVAVCKNQKIELSESEWVIEINCDENYEEKDWKCEKKEWILSEEISEIFDGKIFVPNEDIQKEWRIWKFNELQEPIWNNETKKYSYPEWTQKSNYPAFEYCEEKWMRLPTIWELIMLTDYENTNSQNAYSIADNIKRREYWSSNINILQSRPSPYSVDFSDGTTFGRIETTKKNILCIQDDISEISNISDYKKDIWRNWIKNMNTPDKQRYILLESWKRIYKDTITWLEWQRITYSGNSFNNANDIINHYTNICARYWDWEWFRLPTIYELRTLLTINIRNPHSHSYLYPIERNNPYLSTTKDNENENELWYAWFALWRIMKTRNSHNNIPETWIIKISRLNIACVRNPNDVNQ